MKRELILALLIAAFMPVIVGASSHAEDIPKREELVFRVKARIRNPNLDLTGASFSDAKIDEINKSFDSSYQLKILSYDEDSKSALVEVNSVRFKMPMIQKWHYDGVNWTERIDKEFVVRPSDAFPRPDRR